MNAHVYILSHSVESDSVTLWSAAHQIPLSMGILQAGILEWVAMPSSRGFPNSKIKPRSPALLADSLPSEPREAPVNAQSNLIIRINNNLSDFATIL